VQAAADFLLRWQYAGLFLVILAEEAGVPLPLPGDLFIATMGFLAHSHRAAFAPTALVVATATVLGATFLYAVARTAGRPLLVRVGRRFGYTAEREARLEGWLARRGAAAVVVGRLVPGLRIVMTVLAGALRLPLRTFVAGTAVAGLVWATLYFWLGYALGAGVEWLGPETLARAWPVLAVALAAAGAVAILRWRRARREAAAGVDPP
jgi:membrane-associated protein